MTTSRTKPQLKVPTETYGPKGPCSCGSSDGRQKYRAVKEEYRKSHPDTWFCFVCRKSGLVETEPEKPSPEPTVREGGEVPPGQTTGAWVSPDPWRGLTTKTLERYGVRMKDDGNEFLFPYAQRVKIRGREEKTFVSSKSNPHSHKVNQEGDLFGQQLFAGGGKKITITEGELDAMSLYQSFGKDFPVVSIPDGAQAAAKACEKAFQFLDSFEEIVIMFDADEPGRQAAEEVAKMFPGKTSITKLDETLKDANGYLTVNKREALIDAFWRSEPYRPSDVTNADSLLEELLAPAVPALFQWPYPELQNMTDGVRPGELVVFTAGTGIGKSSAAREIIDAVLQQTEKTNPFKVGMLMLEENKITTIKRQVAIRLKKRIYRSDVEVSQDELKKAHMALFGSKRVEIYSQLKVTTPDDMLSRIGFMIRGLGCKLILLDHLSFIMSGAETDDERREIDQFMTKLRALTEATGAVIIMISHLSKQGGDNSHEEGGRVMLSHLRGSGAIAQISDMVLALERDPQGSSRKTKTGRKKSGGIPKGVTIWRLLKNRWIGDVGPVCITKFDRETGVSNYLGPVPVETHELDESDAL